MPKAVKRPTTPKRAPEPAAPPFLTARKPPLNGAFEGVMRQMRHLATASGDAKLLGGTVQPDEELLALCAESLEAINAHGHQWDVIRATPLDRSNPERLRDEFAKGHEMRARAKQILRRAGKIKAKTAAGIYAKAVLVQRSSSGASVLAASLAADLLDNPTLRASLWPARIEGRAEA